MSIENPTPPAPEAPATPPPGPSPYAPPPAPAEYAAPPAYGAPPPPPARRGRGPLIAIVLVVLLVILAGGGYAVGGFVYANSKVNSATDAYNKVVDHENALTDLFNKLDAQFKSNNNDPASASSDSIKQDKTLNLQLASQSKSAQPTVESDDTALANAASSLNENSWLTALSTKTPGSPRSASPASTSQPPGSTTQGLPSPLPRRSWPTRSCTGRSTRRLTTPRSTSTHSIRRPMRAT